MMDTLRPNAHRAKAAIALIWVVTAFSIAMLFFELNALFGIFDFEYEYYHDEDMLQSFLYVTFEFIRNGLLVSTFISAFTFILWFRRAYWNLQQISFGLFSYTDGWAAGGWFIPIGNLYIPYRIMRELFEETNNLLSNNLKTYTMQLETRNIGLWWGLWITSNILANISSRFDLGYLGILLAVISTVLYVVDAIIIVKIITAYSAIEPVLVDLQNDEDGVLGLQSESSLDQ